MKANILALLLFLFALVSCGNDDDVHKEESHEFRDSLLGWYRLEAAYTDIPLDLNHDGMANTNLFDEVTYCNMSLHLESYTSHFTYRENRNIVKIAVYTPASKYILEQESYSTCLFDNYRFYEIEISEESPELNIIYTYPEFEDEFRVWIQEVTWEDEIAYFTFKKEFYTSAGTWEEVTLYMEYKLDPDYGKN
ncbi:MULTISPECIES: hypothetical protein [Mesonia]|uniref:Uncharacterized protein n=1 Tax=Mesonia oceanica TaxID=2687242 RepID=A0AC61Y612_9FLAO|nr:MULTISPECIES: hypothetical protein [Mesonia]MAN28915.1 hypothetical protein [Mesonia sp.]MAQ42696.1 hypothetical protein [Mesonia sp.]MBJ99233.1 hypothetical protein [Flavobacteriaceae bacterium]VVU99768.1 hypothetical protein FVB9532_01027 [Mesonia oceanica]|tara:strand:+ start:941 stop:1519 length:579 start_codon:yes stop_codon:yes gene_type:complete